MKAFNPLKCPETDFSLVESNQILVSAAAYDVITEYRWEIGGDMDFSNDMRFSVITDDEGFVLTIGKENL